MKIDASIKYRVVAVMVAPDRVMFGYLPNDNYAFVGDLVELEDCSRGTVIVAHDYQTAEDVIKAEQYSMVEFQRVIATFRRDDCDWGDDYECAD